MKTFDTITAHRPALANSYMDMLLAQPGRPLALFAPRRVGKTFFLDNDLTPVAKERGFLPVYADLWLHKVAPLAAINHALLEALDDIDVPTGHLAKASKTQVKSVGAMGFNVSLGEGPTRRPLPDNPALCLDALIVRVAKACGGHILLLLDEAQTLGEVSDGVSIIAALRAVLHKHRDRVCAVFTGSSQEGLALLMNTAGAPMYQFAQMLNFPLLGDEYLRMLARHFSSVHEGKTLDLDALREVFASIGYRPALMRDIVKAMSAEGQTNLPKGLENFMRSDSQVAVWNALLNSVDAFERGVLIAIAHEEPPLGQLARKRLAGIPGVNPTISKIRTVLDKLQRQGLLARTAAGPAIDDPLFAQYLRRQPQRAGTSQDTTTH